MLLEALKDYVFYCIVLFVSTTFAQENHYTNKVITGAELGYGFTVEYFDTFKVLTNSITNEKYALVCCGQALSNFTIGYHAVVNVPLTSVSIDQALTVLPFFELLGLTNKISAIQPTANVTSPCFANISDSPGGSTVDVVFTTHPSAAAFDTKPQYISVSSKDDSLTPIQQSAWIIFIGHFFELEQEAKSVFDQIQDKYNCHKSNLANSGSKNIAWTRYDSSNKVWTLQYDHYIHSLIKDAGMKLVVENNQSTTFQNLTLFQEAVRDVDYIIDGSDPINFRKDFAYGDWLSALGLTPNSNLYSFLTNQNVYRTDKMISKSGYSGDFHRTYDLCTCTLTMICSFFLRDIDWLIRHSARADLAISDIIHMVYNTYEPSYNTTWIRSFARLQSPVFITNTSYPSCTNTVQRWINTCTHGAFKPNSTMDGTSEKSVDSSTHSLSTGGKVGVAIGVVVGVAAIVIVGASVYRRRRFSSQPKEGSFVRMNDI
ncbi:hypothetical protein BD560DRAFT_11803 [Blakeslea trispora]|nr:hypothetical protein BD560DRAFT_11803 [Blakeslea trispora]